MSWPFSAKPGSECVASSSAQSQACAEHRLVAEAVVEAQLGDAMDVAQPLRELEVGMVLQAAREGGDYLRLGQVRRRAGRAPPA